MNEKQFYQKLRDKLPEVHWTRIENSVMSGVFDVNGCFKGKEVWVELKEYYLNMNTVLLRPSQYAWLVQRRKHQANLWVLGFDRLGRGLYVYDSNLTVEPFRRWLKVNEMPYAIFQLDSCFTWQTLLSYFFCSPKVG